MKNNAPSSSLGQSVQQVVNNAEEAVASNNANAPNNIPSGAAIDTYCGVNGTGNKLPAYFNKGMGTAFCSTFVPIWQGTMNASNQAGVLSVLTADQAQVNQLATALSSLPMSIRAKATAATPQGSKRDCVE